MRRSFFERHKKYKDKLDAMFEVFKSERDLKKLQGIKFFLEKSASSTTLILYLKGQETK